MHGTPPVRALFWEFPDEPNLFGIDRQFLVGRDILVTPVLTPNVSTVDGKSRNLRDYSLWLPSSYVLMGKYRHIPGRRKRDLARLVHA